jgi:hypothetical protein
LRQEQQRMRGEILLFTFAYFNQSARIDGQSLKLFLHY